MNPFTTKYETWINILSQHLIEILYLILLNGWIFEVKLNYLA